MRNFLFIILFLFLATSCQSDKKDKPKNLIPESKMVEVLTEMSLLQGARSYNRQELERRGIDPDEYLWQKFDIDSAQFSKSSDYYAANYKIYQRIYEKVKDTLEGLKAKFDSIKEQEELVRDSIRKVQRERRDSINEVRRSQGLDSLESIVEDTTEIRRDGIIPTISKGASLDRDQEIRQDSL